MIKLVIFDLDDTLVYTHDVFKRNLLKTTKQLAQKLNEPHDLVLKLFEENLRNSLDLYKVNPNKIWRHTLQNMKTSYLKLDGNLLDNTLSQIFKIYVTVPKTIEGAKELLKYLKTKGIRIALLSHAEEEWTHFKLTKTELKYFFDAVYTASVDVEKSHIHWKNVIEDQKISSKHTMVVGDNVKGDMVAANQAGITNLVWLDNKKSWDSHRSGELPEGTKVVRNLIEIKKLV